MTSTAVSETLKPGVGLLVKLGSIAVHAEELISPGRHQFDINAIQTLLEDSEVKEWLQAMGKMAFLPVKR